MKTLLVTQRLITNTAYDEVREGIDVNWGNFLSACNIPFFAASYSVAPNTYFDSYDILGVLLTGGNDLASLEDTAINRQRDNYERQLVKECQKHKLPLLGVCRGMQFLASQSEAKILKKAGHVAINHEVKISPDNCFYEAYAKTTEVNSFHNYCITEVSPEFQVTCISAVDGIVEAIESKHHKNAAMMWHPERYSPFRQADINFFRSFFCSSC